MKIGTISHPPTSAIARLLPGGNRGSEVHCTLSDRCLLVSAHDPLAIRLTRIDQSQVESESRSTACELFVVQAFGAKATGLLSLNNCFCDFI